MLNIAVSASSIRRFVIVCHHFPPPKAGREPARDRDNFFREIDRHARTVFREIDRHARTVSGASAKPC
jgi:hypothetical protein